MNICMYASMYVLYAYIRVCMHPPSVVSHPLCVYAFMYICMHVCIHVCIYIIFKLGFERYRGNCPSWEGELSGGIVRGKCPWELSRGDNVRAPEAQLGERVLGFAILQFRCCLGICHTIRLKSCNPILIPFVLFDTE